MKNNFCEDNQKHKEIKDFHNNLVESTHLPKWCRFNCPFCDKLIAYGGIRSVSLKLNARNFGDVCVEFFCDTCNLMETMYYMSVANNTYQFCDLLTSNHTIDQSPVTEEKMYKLNYNNLIKKMEISKKETRNEHDKA